MYHLNEEELNFVRKEVERQDIHFRHLANDLIDHISCEIEEMISRGRKFQDAYKEVLGIIGTDGLQDLQKDTLYLTDKNYRIMKNSMKISGVAGMALLVFGILFKMQHYPGGDILLVIGFLLLGGLFFPASLMVMRKEYQQLDRPLIYITLMIGGLAIIFAVLLKVLHWPGANILFLLGYSMMDLLFLPLLLFSLLKNTSDSQLKTTYVIGAFSLFFCMAGGLFKMLHYPGAFILLIVGSLGLTAVFFPMYVYKMYKASDRLDPQFIFLCIGMLYFNMFNLLLAYN
ncbi:MAG: hypothetical protein WCO63_07525 [Bacteroidota bacterium]